MKESELVEKLNALIAEHGDYKLIDYLDRDLEDCWYDAEYCINAIVIE